MHNIYIWQAKYKKLLSDNNNILSQYYNGTNNNTISLSHNSIKTPCCGDYDDNNNKQP